ncbi:hypothetical protein EC968_001507 [Mortierella alpina]|nr:hypothetical protein EC968_001507 [Mortierella alpina]
MPADDHCDENPFYQVRYGVQFQNLVPQPPTRFPYASQIAYASRYGSAVTANSSDRADFKEEERQRERQNRRALLRRRSTAGRFRRRPNITLPPTEGRITEPVEVARIRRAYCGAFASSTWQQNEDKDKGSLLERINRQVRTGTQEWTLTGVQQLQEEPAVSTTVNVLPGNVTRVAISDANQNTVSRRSLNRAVSTRPQGRPVRREDLRPSRSSFSTQWEAYRRKKLIPKRDSIALQAEFRNPVVECNSNFAQDLTARLEQVAAKDQSAQDSREVPMPVLMVTPCPGPALETTPHDNTNKLVSQITEPTNFFLMAPPVGSLRGEAVERGLRRGSSSPYASDHDLESDNVSVRVRSSRSSVHSASSYASAASSIANSIYSTLSQDWIRPPYFAKSKSPRYPLSLQHSIRTLPPHIMIAVRRTSELNSDVRTVAEATRLAKHIRTRGMRDQNGGMIRPDVGDQLHTVEFSVVFRSIEGSEITQEENPTLMFMDPYKSAFPLTADSMGFVEYNSYDECEEFLGDGSEGSALGDAGEAEKCTVLDVNDTSAMVAMGIDPLDPHPAPLAFYNTHFAYFQKYGRFVGDDDRSDLSFQDMKGQDPRNVQQVYDGAQNLAAEEEEEVGDIRPAHAQVLMGDPSMPPSSPPTHSSRDSSSRSKTVLKKAYARVRKFLSSGDSPPPTMTTTILTELMDRLHACSQSKIDTDTRSEVVMDGQGCDAKGDQDWITRLPSGARALGQFDRDWLDAMPPLSRNE